MSIEGGRNHSIVLRCGLNKVTVTRRNGLFDGGFYLRRVKVFWCRSYRSSERGKPSCLMEMLLEVRYVYTSLKKSHRMEVEKEGRSTNGN